MRPDDDASQPLSYQPSKTIENATTNNVYNDIQSEDKQWREIN